MLQVYPYSANQTQMTTHPHENSYHQVANYHVKQKKLIFYNF